MRKYFYFPKTRRHHKFEISWDVKLQIAMLAAFFIATVVAYITINWWYT